ncbi:MAG: hypothetical protein MUP69_10365 [Candidatus Atribacteria bacterium]|nr:hypothetical protein [Candidatus Atribacteria bacterium]
MCSPLVKFVAKEKGINIEEARRLLKARRDFDFSNFKKREVKGNCQK